MPPGERHHPVTRFHVADTLCAFQHLPRKFQAGDKGQVRLHLVLAFRHQNIGKIYASGFHANAHLPFPKPRARRFADIQIIDGAKLRDLKGAHGEFPINWQLLFGNFHWAVIAMARRSRRISLPVAVSGKLFVRIMQAGVL